MTKLWSQYHIAELTENAYEYARLAYEQEEKREDSLINQATQMTTYFSFVSVLILMIVPIIIVDGTIIPVKYTAIISVITLVLLFTSMILAVIVQWRYKYQSLSSPLTMFNHIINNKEYFKTPEQRNKSFVQSLETTWASKRKINDKRANEDQIRKIEPDYPHIYEMYSSYKSELDNKNLMDFDDQMVFAYWILKKT